MLFFSSDVFRTLTCVFHFLIVMSFPADGVELGFRNHIEDVRTFLDSRHPDRYTVFNLSPKSYRSAKFHNRVSYILLV